MLAETPPEAFHINSLFVDSHQIVERSNEPLMRSSISKKECQELYPHHDGVDGELFYRLLVQFRDRHFAEKLISLCNCDFSLALQIGTLCHGNVFLFDRLCVLFSNDLSFALRFLSCFLSSLSSSSPFLLASQFLSHFSNDVSSAISFLSRFDNDGSSASSFLSQFNNDASQATRAIKISNWFSDESSFKNILCGCNGSISAVEAFATLTGIKHLELLYDSEQLPRNENEFHSRCDDRGPTVSFVCANGNCVCGVVNSSWISPSDPTGKWVSDPSAYLLRLTPNPQKYSIKSDKTDRALYCRSDRGPCFGLGSDFGLMFSSDVKYPKGMFGWAKTGWSYDLPLNGFLFPKTDAESFPIDRIVVCKYTK